MTYPVPPVVSERQIGPDHECEWCSGVMLRLANAPSSCPATLDEAKRLHIAGTGTDLGGGNAAQLKIGLAKRYNMASTVVPPSFASLWAALVPGKAAAVAGNPAHFPYGHYLRRFLPDYNGGHCIYAGRMDTSDYVWWIDPEGPDDGTYHGERVSSAELAVFIGSWDGAHVVAGMQQGTTGGGSGTVGLALTLPANPVAGTVAIPANTDAINVSDASHYTVPQAAARPGYLVSLAAPLSGPGYLVDLNGDQMHFVRAAAVAFTPAQPPVGPIPTPLGPGVYKVGP